MNTLSTLKSNPCEAIVRLLENDPRLISKHTTRQYKADLFAFEAWRAGRTLTKSLVEEYAAELQHEDKAPATINQRLAAIRWYARKIADLALDQDDERLAKHTARVALVEDVKGERLEKGRHIEQGSTTVKSSATLRVIVCFNIPSPRILYL
jgi:hypothetical protein